MVDIEISKRLVAINSASAVASKLINVAVVFWLLGFLKKAVSDGEFAVYAVVQSLMLFVPLLATMVGAGLTRFVTEGYAQGNRERVTEIISTLAPLSLLTALLICVSGLAIALNIEKILTIEPEFVADAQLMFALLVVVSALRIGAMPFQIGLQVRQRFIVMHVIGLGSQLIWTAGLLGLLLGVSPRALWTVVASIPAALFDVGLMCWLSCRALPDLRWRRGYFRRELVGPLLSFGGWTMIARVAAVAREACGTLILNELPASRAAALRQAAVGSFKLGATVETKIFPMALVPLTTTLPALTAMHATGQIDRLRHAFFRITRYVFWAFMLPTVPLVVYRHEFWTLYIGPEEHVAATVMMLLLLKAVVVFPQPVLAQLVAAKDMTKPMAIRVVIIEAGTVLATLYAVAFHGFSAVGSAAVTLLATLVGHPLLHWQLGLRLTESRWGDWLRQTVFPGIAPALVAFPVAFGMHAISTPSSWITLGLHASVTCTVYFAALVLFCLQPNERADLQHVLSRASAKLGRGPKPS